MPSHDADRADARVLAALRLGWAAAEVRGRTWRAETTPAAAEHPDAVPTAPAGVLPLRHQRTDADSAAEARATLAHLAREVGAPEPPTPGAWPDVAAAFVDWDREVQDRLAREDEDRANAYLLGRGLAESYWSLGDDDTEAGASLGYLFDGDRVRELERMLGRLRLGRVHELTPSAVAGSLRAWEAVAEDGGWRTAADRRTVLHEQQRRWYQLLVLGQDPTTLIRPESGGLDRAYLRRAARTFAPQAGLAGVALAALSTYVVLLREEVVPGLTAALGAGGLGAFLAAGALTRGKAAAQRLVARMRQDAYTDLVALCVTTVPERPGDERGWRGLRDALEPVVRRRRVTPPTPPPPG